MIPGMGPLLTLGAWFAGFIKRTAIQCYTENMKALGLVVLENKIFTYIFLLSIVDRKYGVVLVIISVLCTI